VVEIEPQAFDLGATMKAEIVEISTPHGPLTIIHEDQDFAVKVRVKLSGTILHWLCGKLGVNVGFESCGDGFEGDLYDERDLVPCGNGEYEFLVKVPGGTLKGGRYGKKYALCITLGSLDQCGHAGIVFGHCHDFSVAIVKKVEHPPVPVTP
jgi:hypothetical protein